MSGPSAQRSLVTRTPVRLAANPARAIATLFMPGEEMPEDHSRATAVIEGVLALDDDQVTATLADLTTRFSRRHRRLEAIFQRHFDIIAPRLGASVPRSQDRRLLIGAYFSREESPEGTALMSPSIVEHPDQTGLSPGELRFVLSARAVGAGHVSYIEFRTGIIGNDGTIRIDDPGGLLETGQPRPPVYERDIFHAQLAEVGYDDDIAHLVLDSLGARFGKAALDQAVGALDRHVLSREDGRETVRWLDWVAANNYEVVFPEDTAIDERVLVPTGPTESHGIEDARFVRFVDDGAVTYYATYTAYDGSHVVPQLLQTTDFRTFRAHQLSGPSAKNKGMALFPRRIGGQYVSLSRWDRENSSLAVSDDGWAWGPPTTIHVPRHTWEIIQVGNCGSPIKTPAGWLVLTHGVGPMRTYAIGATLLDLDDPLRVVATLPTPLIAPADDERDGYVPNVVYSCGALVHGELMVLPYGFGDQAIGIALVDMPELLNRLLSASH